MTRKETLTDPATATRLEPAKGVEIVMLATGELGAVGLTTAIAVIQPRCGLPAHTHPFSEVIIVLEGTATIVVENRRYRLTSFDTMHIPAGIRHAVSNENESLSTRLHCSFPSATPHRTIVDDAFDIIDSTCSTESTPEYLFRFQDVRAYQLAANTEFRDLFASRFGVPGICGGYGIFEPGASLPLHFHDYDESITIVHGDATCQVEQRLYNMNGYQTACIPKGLVHRFLNQSTKPMAMIWVYAGDEPTRTLVDSKLYPTYLTADERHP